MTGLTNYGQGGDGGGLGAQDLGAQRSRFPAGGDGGGSLAIGPTAFGTGQDRHGIYIDGRLKALEQYRRAGLFIKNKSARRGISGNGAGEGFGGRDFGYGQTAGLLAAFVGDLTPAVDALQGRRSKALFGTFGIDGDKARDTEFRRLFDEPLEAIELDERGVERDFELRRRIWEGFNDGKCDVARRNFGDFGEVGVVGVGDFVALAGLGAEHAGEMAGVVTGKFGAMVVDAVDEEAAAGQKTW